jgi:hypothetical protein
MSSSSAERSNRFCENCCLMNDWTDVSILLSKSIIFKEKILFTFLSQFERVLYINSHLLVHFQYGMKRVIRIRDRWGPQPWQSLPLAVQGQGLYWRNPYTEAPSSIQDTASLRFSFGGQQLLVLACSCSLVSLPSMRTPAPPSCR